MAISGEFAYVKRLQILHLEDNLDDAELIKLTLQAGGLQFDITRIQSSLELREALKDHTFDLILADYNLPSFNGSAALQILKETSLATPFILVTGSLGEELAVETLKQGATDFVLKDRLVRLTPAVVRAIQESEEKKNRKRAEMALKESEEKYRTLVEQVPAVVYIAEPGLDGRWLYVSPRIESILGFTAEQWLNDPELRSKQILIDDREPALLKQFSPERDLYISEYRMHKKDGDIIWIREEAVILQNDGGKTLIHGLMIDITDVKNAEETKQNLENELRQVQKIEAVGQLAGGVAHDFNNILMVISSYCELLLLQLNPKDSAFKHLQEMRSAAEKGSGLTRQLLAFSRKQRLDPVIVHLNQVISQMEGMLQRVVREDVELSIFLDPNVPLTKVDTSQIERLLVNLVVNASDAMPHGGKLSIATTRVELDKDSTRSLVDVLPGTYAMIRVSDTGIGMDSSTLSRIFEPFFTTKGEGKGTGLGLSTVYGIVKQSGGTIRVLSEVGKGTMFRIYFPEVKGELPTNASAEQSSDHNGNGETILLVDDNDAVRDAVASILKLKGYEVVQATNGLDAFDRIKGKHGPIDLLISDVVMPVMNGRDLARQLREKLPGLKVLLMSGYSEDGVTDPEPDPGIVFISKPVQMQTLLAKVRALLKEASQSPNLPFYPDSC